CSTAKQKSTRSTSGGSISALGPNSGDIPLLYTGKPISPNLIELDRRVDVPQAILGYVSKLAIFQEVARVHPADSVTLRRLDTKSLTVKVQVEASCSTVPPAHAVKRELLGQIAMWFGAVTVPEPVLARDFHVQDCRSHIHEGNVEPAAIESDDTLVVFRDLPKAGQQLGLVHAGDELDPL